MIYHSVSSFLPFTVPITGCSYWGTPVNLSECISANADSATLRVQFGQSEETTFELYLYIALLLIFVFCLEIVMLTYLIRSHCTLKLLSYGIVVKHPVQSGLLPLLGLAFYLTLFAFLQNIMRWIAINESPHKRVCARVCYSLEVQAALFDWRFIVDTGLIMWQYSALFAFAFARTHNAYNDLRTSKLFDSSAGLRASGGLRLSCTSRAVQTTLVEMCNSDPLPALAPQACCARARLWLCLGCLQLLNHLCFGYICQYCCHFDLQLLWRQARFSDEDWKLLVHELHRKGHLTSLFPPRVEPAPELVSAP